MHPSSSSSSSSSPSSSSAPTGRGHAKVILIGEHAVVYGHPALAAGLSVGITATARPGSGRLRVPAWQLEATAADDSPVGRALSAIVRRLEAPALDFDAAADVPSRAGLGSSAALAVAVARAAAAACGRSAEDAAVDAAVDEAETIFHGNPSGIDAAAAKTGVAGRFSRAEGWRPVRVHQAIRLCVGLSGRPRDTAAQVAAVARLRERLSVADDILKTLGKLADEACEALGKGDVDGLGRTFNAAHGLLYALRVSGRELDALVETANAAGAIGAKLTGAGGGGAVIALAPGHERDVLTRWKAAGFDGFMAEIAATPEVRA